MSSSTSPKPSGETTAPPKTEEEGRAREAASHADPAAEAANTGEDKSANGAADGKADADAEATEAQADSKPGEPEPADAEADTARTNDDEPTRTESASEPSSAADDEPEDDEPLDLRALFASDEPEFADPTDTFEMARGAKPEPRAGASEPTSPGAAELQPDSDTDLPFDLPADSVTSDSETSDAGAESGLAGLGGGSAAEDSAAANAFGGTPGDPLADAVQSALRSVYGEDEQGENHGYTRDKGEGASGPILQWAGANVAEDASAQPDDFTLEPTDERPDKAAIDEETTEAVLSYLYEHVGSEDTGETASPAAPDPASDGVDARDRMDHRSEDAWAALAQQGDTEMPAARTAGYAGPTGLDPAQPAEAPRPTAQAQSAPSETFYPPVDVGAIDTEPSGKLLGAAGLGLIGGIAATGVAAVFVFNSFVTQQDPAATQQRASAQLAETPAGTTGTGDRTEPPAEPSGANQATTTAETAATGTATSENTQTAATTPELNPPATTPAATEANESASALIDANAVSGRAGQAIPLALSVADSDGDRFIRITGLPEGVRLSAGVDTGNGSWLLSAGRASDLTLSAPEDFAGAFSLQAQLLGADARTPLSDRVSFDVQVAATQMAEAEAAETRTAAVAAETSPATEPAASPIEQAESLLRAGDVQGARDILRAETEAGSARAALALGTSYDPRTFTGLSSPNASPDATEAFRWYQRAAELGNPNGNSQINELKAWLLR